MPEQPSTGHATCPGCGRNISLYTMRNGYRGIRKHNANRDEMCSGSYALEPGTLIRTVHGTLVEPQARR